MLPNELLGLVFQHTHMSTLRAFSLVSRNWHAVALQSIATYPLTPETAAALHMHMYFLYWQMKKNKDCVNMSNLFTSFYVQVLDRLERYYAGRHMAFPISQLCGNNYINIRQVSGVARHDGKHYLRPVLYQNVTVRNYVTGVNCSAVCISWVASFEYIAALLTDLTVCGKAWFLSILTQHVAFNSSLLQRFAHMKEKALKLQHEEHAISMFFHHSSFLDATTLQPIFTPQVQEARLRLYQAVPIETTAKLADLAQKQFNMLTAPKFSLCIPWIARKGDSVYYPIQSKHGMHVLKQWRHDPPPTYAELCCIVKNVHTKKFEETTHSFQLPAVQTREEFLLKLKAKQRTQRI